MNMDAITFLSSSYLRNTHGSLSLHSKPLIAFDGEKAIDCKDTEVMVQKLKARLDVNAGTHIGIHYTLSISVFAQNIYLYVCTTYDQAKVQYFNIVYIYIYISNMKKYLDLAHGDVICSRRW